MVVVDRVSSADFHRLTGGATGYTVLKNQQPISLSQIQPYDVVTYDSMSKHLLVSDLRLTCKYQNPSPSPKAPTSSPCWDTPSGAGECLGLHRPGVGRPAGVPADDRGRQVAGILPSNNQTRSTAMGLVTSETTVDLFLPNGGILELKGASSKLKNLNQVCTITSSDENTLNASRLSTQRAPGDFDPSAMTVGGYKVAPGVRVYEQFREGAQVAVPLSSLNYGAIPQDQIAGVHKNSSELWMLLCSIM